MSNFSHNPQTTAKIGGHPLHPMLIYFPIAAFVATLVTDLAFMKTDSEFWFFAGRWLLIGGVVTAALAALAGLIDFLGSAQIRDISAAWVHAGGNILVVILELANLYSRFNGAANVVTGTQTLLSVASVVLLLVTGWLGGELVFRHRVGVRDASH